MNRFVAGLAVMLGIIPNPSERLEMLAPSPRSRPTPRSAETWSTPEVAGASFPEVERAARSGARVDAFTEEFERELAAGRTRRKAR